MKQDKNSSTLRQGTGFLMHCGLLLEQEQHSTCKVDADLPFARIDPPIWVECWSQPTMHTKRSLQSSLDGGACSCLAQAGEHLSWQLSAQTLSMRLAPWIKECSPLLDSRSSPHVEWNMSSQKFPANGRWMVGGEHSSCTRIVDNESNAAAGAIFINPFNPPLNKVLPFPHNNSQSSRAKANYWLSTAA